MCDVGVEKEGEMQEKVRGCERNREGNEGSESDAVVGVLLRRNSMIIR